MTVHAVKGLEFDYVFVIGMEEGIFPHYNSINEGTNDAIEEERRLCYVAITRAKKELWIINCKKRLLYGQTKSNPPSRFISEIDNKYIELNKQTTSILKKASKFNKNLMFNKNTSNYQIGDHVKHVDYGEGVVVAVDKTLITIAFPHPLGTKKFMKNHRSLIKIDN
jgi:DNA helicase-2/ATP-dependent DNA helicase PcrA